MQALSIEKQLSINGGGGAVSIVVVIWTVAVNDFAAGDYNVYKNFYLIWGTEAWK